MLVSHLAPESVRFPPSPPLPQAQPPSSLTWTREMTSPLAGLPAPPVRPPPSVPCPAAVIHVTTNMTGTSYRPEAAPWHGAWSSPTQDAATLLHKALRDPSLVFLGDSVSPQDLGNTLPASSFTLFPALPQHVEPLFTAGSFLRAHCWEFAQGDAKLPEVKTHVQNAAHLPKPIVGSDQSPSLVLCFGLGLSLRL